MASQSKILNHIQIEQKLTRIAHEIYENHFDEKELVFIGIEKRGLELAKQISNQVAEISNMKVSVLPLKVDKKQPIKSQEPTFKKSDLNNKTVLLVDDVLNTGHVLAYGVKLLLDYPVKKLKTVILVNRRHRKFPIRADYVGLTLATTMQEHISVELGKKENAVFLT